MTHALTVANLTIERSYGGQIVEDVSFSINSGEVLGLVGESGCGKTTLSLGLLGHTRSGLRFAAGSVRLLPSGEEMVGRSDRALRRLRGKVISYVAQDPSTALDPSIRVEDQIHEVTAVHRLSAVDAGQLLESVGLPTDVGFRRRFPHQLSGGQQQRLAIALALSCQPRVVVLDEPTTALDVVTQAQLLNEIRRLKTEMDLAIVYVSHDLSVVASLADRIAVMYAGRIVEMGETARLLHRPRHPYSLGLIASIPDHEMPRVLRGIPGVAVSAWEAPGGCGFAPRCPQRTERCTETVPPLETVAQHHDVRCFHWMRTPPPSELDARAFPAAPQVVTNVLEVVELRASHQRESIVAADNVSFGLGPGECLALVGESGSGKTTIARCIVGLHRRDAGQVLLDGDPLADSAKDRPTRQRRRLQIVFQNPYESLNPRHTVEETIARPLQLFDTVPRGQVGSEVARLLELVRLPGGISARFPHELSGGERQRVAIARALAPRPDVVVCDEITSALDVSVQAVVLDVLWELRRSLGLALLFITHDLGVVASVADGVVVLEAGQVREQGAIPGALSAPSSEYTRRLLHAAPTLAPWVDPGNGPAGTTLDRFTSHITTKEIT